MTYFKRKPNPQKVLEKEIHNKRIEFFEKLYVAAIIGFGGYAMTALPKVIREIEKVTLLGIAPNLAALVAAIAFIGLAVYNIKQRK